jgi:glutathionylspermidine synthase
MVTLEKFDARLLEYIMKQPQEYRESRRQYHEELENRGFTYHGESIPSFFHPYVLDQKRFQAVKKHAEIMAEILFKVYELFFAREEIRNILDFPPALLEWMQVQPKYDTPVPISRYDAYYDPVKDTMMFNEFNADGTGGMNEANTMEEAFLATPLGDKLAKEFDLYNCELRKTVLQVLLENYRKAGGTKTHPNIAIVDWKESATPEEFAALYETFTREGYPVVIADPRDLTYEPEEDVLRCGDFVIDLVYRRIVTVELVQRRDEAEAFLQAYMNNSVVTVGSVRTEIIHSKKVFCLLSDPAYAHYFSPGERKFLEEHIPWTRKLTSQDSSLLHKVLDNKDALMLKPHDGYASRGHIVGQDCTPEDWEGHIKRLVDTNYLVQEKIAGPEKVFYTDGTLPGKLLKVNLACYVFNGKLSGFYTRVSPHVVISTLWGGAEVPTIISKL